MMDTAGSKTALDDLEATSLAENHVALVYPDILERNVSVAVRRIVKANDGQHTLNGHARSVGRHQNDRLLAMLVGVGGI
jgi:hypothetical protein